MTAPLQSPSLTTPPLTPSTDAASAAGTYADLNGLAALKNAPRSPETIRAVSQQVEALFLQMMLKSMRDASEADGELDNNETSMYQDLFDKQAALTLSKRQDLGIARLFERQLGSKASPGTSTAVPAAAPMQAPGARSSEAHHAAQFVSQVLPTIRRAARGLGVNPLGLLAQAALETGWGQRMPRTEAGTPSLNMFGIKAGEDWRGPRAVADTLEFNGGVATQRRIAFRAYASIEESVSDFANLLASSPRYRAAVSAGSDAQAYIHNLAKSGYATDPEYGNKLNQILNSSTLRTALKTAVAAL